MYAENFLLYAENFYAQNFAQKNKNTLGVRNFLRYTQRRLKTLFTSSVKNLVRQAFFCFFDVRWKFFTLKILHKETKIRFAHKIFYPTCK